MKTIDLLLEKLNKEEIDLLSYLIHDKSHILSSGVRNHVLDNVIYWFKVKSPTIYRGLHETDIQTLSLGNRFQKYLSASESIGVAEKFGTRVVRINPTPAFCYWKWVVGHYEDMKKKSPKDFREADGQYLIDSAKKEREWIIPFNSKLVVNKNGTYTVK